MKIKGFVTREEAGLVRPQSFSRNITPEKGGCTVHWAGPPQKITSHMDCYRRWRGYQKYHMDNGYVDIAYSAGFCQHGYVFAGRGTNVRSGANGSNVGNQNFYAFCWIGGLGDAMTTDSISALEWLILSYREKGNAGQEIVDHSHHKKTECAGDTWRNIIATYYFGDGDDEDEEDQMDRVLAEKIEQTNNIQRALLEERVAAYRQLSGLPPEKGSDQIWVNRISAGTHSLGDAQEAIRKKAADQA